MPNLSDFVGGSGFEIIDSQTFTSSGTWTKPALAKDNDIVVIDMWGGGASGNSNSLSGSGNDASGGGGGGFSRDMFRVTALNATETVTVGAGGSAVTSSIVSNDGGTTSVTIGTTTISVTGGEKTGSATAPGDGGYSLQRLSRAIASGSDIRPVDGWAGGRDRVTSAREKKNATFGGGAGGAGDETAAVSIAGGSSVFGGGGGGGVNSTSVSGAGGSSVYGGAGGAGVDNGAGIDGTAPGGGGGGSTGGNLSGAGARGEVKIYVIRGTFPPIDFVFEV